MLDARKGGESKLAEGGGSVVRSTTRLTPATRNKGDQKIVHVIKESSLKVQNIEG